MRSAHATRRGMKVWGDRGVLASWALLESPARAGTSRASIRTESDKADMGICRPKDFITTHEDEELPAASNTNGLVLQRASLPPQLDL
jgi:hypothetical protein